MRASFRPLTALLVVGSVAGIATSVQADAWLKDPITGCAIWSDRVDTFRETATWAGPCEDGKASGEGVLVWFKDDNILGRYEGGMRDGKLHGRGILFYRPPDTIASMKAEIRDKTLDQGQIHYHYEGTLRAGEMDGRGIMYYSSERGYDRYEGDFRDGEINGDINFKGADGATFVGKAKGVASSGSGLYVGPSGERYEGAYADGKPVGPGVYTAPNGDIFEATFLDGKAHGKVIVTRTNGKREELVWEHGKPLE